MNIVEYTKNLVSAADAKVSDAQSALDSANQEIEVLRQKSSDLMRTRNQLVAEELDTSGVEEKLRDIDNKIKAIAGNLPMLKEAVGQKSKERKALAPIEEQTLICQKYLQKVEIEEISSPNELLHFFGAELHFEDDHAKECCIWFGNFAINLPVVCKVPRVKQESIPDAIAWIPHEWLPVLCPRSDGVSRISLKSIGNASPQQIYYIKDSGQFLSFKPSVKWQVIETSYDSRYKEITKEVTKEYKWGNPENCLLEEIAKSLGDLSLDLDDPADHHLVRELTAKILEVTQLVDQKTYRENTTLQKTGEIEKKLSPHFIKFVESPWTPKIQGKLANFKYYCELGERPRFYNLNVEGAYGFRLRTRDHSWICGSIYLVPESLQYETGSEDFPEIQCKDYQSCDYLRLGRLIIMVSDNIRDKIRDSR